MKIDILTWDFHQKEDSLLYPIQKEGHEYVSSAVEKLPEGSDAIMKGNKNKNMRPEYDFSDGVRGKHLKAYREGHTVKIRKEDGSIETRCFTEEDGICYVRSRCKTTFPRFQFCKQSAPFINRGIGISCLNMQSPYLTPAFFKKPRSRVCAASIDVCTRS